MISSTIRLIFRIVNSLQSCYNHRMDNAQLDQILHDVFIVGISAAALFVKNPNSQQHAASIINLLNQVVLPIADSFLTPKPATPSA